MCFYINYISNHITIILATVRSYIYFPFVMYFSFMMYFSFVIAAEWYTEILKEDGLTLESFRHRVRCAPYHLHKKSSL